MNPEMKGHRLRYIAITGIGIALYVVFSLCLQVPVFENYYLCLGYIVMAVYCYSFGAASGSIVGVLGCILYCLLIGGLRGMPGWALGNLFIGITLGIAFKVVRQIKSTPVRYMVNAIVSILSTAVAILVIKSVTEQLLYAQPFLFRVAKNSYAFLADAFILVVSLPLCINIDRTLKQKHNYLYISK